MKLYQYDIYRYYGKYKENLRQRIFRPKGLKYTVLLRKYTMSKNKLIKFYYMVRVYLYSRKTFIQIPVETKIDKGFYIGHDGRVIISSDAVIGKNVNVATGITIGYANRGEKQVSPIIVDNVWIGTNAVIVGKVHIGNDVLIAPASYVNFDVPDHSIVIGNPGKIIHRENATEKYVNRKV